ncbi:hypothetical protein Vadar_027389 [Vaccinium darrowii]|uniref:Uncharacterized protein n=1 Tax=Vaccinium darrowii TaxID=229202 RepID=A0ACB7Z817_9ERIC|nr:hypothetical protein Vadar_027389 [Vaccinium darrowii]
MKTIKASLNAALFNSRIAGNKVIATYLVVAGEIPEKIGRLKSLESLDLSVNQLMGIIPQSISGLNYLSCLNLSYNNLLGRIPTENQLRTLDDPSSSYLGNNELCGVPLPRNCPGDEKSQPPTSTGHREEHEGDDFENFWFFMAIMSGYVTAMGCYRSSTVQKDLEVCLFPVRGDGQRQGTIGNCSRSWSTEELH